MSPDVKVDHVLDLCLPVGPDGDDKDPPYEGGGGHSNHDHYPPPEKQIQLLIYDVLLQDAKVLAHRFSTQLSISTQNL